MHAPSRLAGLLLAVGVLTAALGTGAAAASQPRVIRHPLRVIPGRMADYRAGVQDGRTTSVGPAAGPALLATPLSTWKIVYQGDGWTPAAKAVMKNAKDYWAAQVQSSVTIKVRVTFKDLPGNVLGSAGPTRMVENWTSGTLPIPDTFYPVALANALSGVDQNGSAPEIVAFFDSRMPWYMGTDNVVPANRISFRGTVLHELAHGLGFIGSAWVAQGQGTFGDPRFTGNDDPWIYDLFTERGDGTPLLGLGPTPLRTALLSNDIWFRGTATDPRAELYAPSTWDPGSSYSHLDEKRYPRGTLNSLMTPIGDFGEGNATAGPIALRMLQDMGWNAPVPTACTRPGDLDADGFNDVVAIAQNGDLVLAPGTDTGKLLARRMVAGGFGTIKHLVMEDWTGDGCADLVGYDGATAQLVVWPVTGDAVLGGRSALLDWSAAGTTWKVTGLAAVGDLDGDGDPDLLVRADRTAPTVQKGQLWLVRGDGAGGLKPKPDDLRFLGTGWAKYTEFFSAGDWNHDGRGDLFVRAKLNNGTLKLFRGRSDGTLAAPKSRGTGWNVYNQLFGSFDLTGDELPEIVGRVASTGSLKIRRAGPNGSFLRGTPVISKGWGAFRLID